jgi:hypothetical protein
LAELRSLVILIAGSRIAQIQHKIWLSLAFARVYEGKKLAWAAIRFLRKEDHYILVMIRIAGLRPAGDQLKLFATALAIVICALLLPLPSAKYHFHLPSRSDLAFYFWAAVVFLVIAYSALRFIVGSKRTDDLTSKALETIVRIYQR